jgi:ribose transport system substrate-binding protein
MKRNNLAADILITMMLSLLVACSSPGSANQASMAEQPGDTRAAVFDQPTLLTDALGEEADLVVTDREIEVARAHLESKDAFIGIIASNIGSEYHFTVAKTASQRAEDLDLAVDLVDAGADAQKQVSIIEDFISRGAVVIILSDFNPEVTATSLRAARDAGVFIVQYAGRSAAEIGGVSISIEDADLGTLAGDYAGQLIGAEFGGQANVVILDFPDAPQVVVRANAIREALLAQTPQAIIVGNYKGGTTEFGLESMGLALQEYPEINVVVSINDAGAYGAYQVLAAAGRTAEDTIIVGIDGEDQALQYIKEGTMYRGTVATAPAPTGEMTINAAVKLLAGSTFPQNIRVPVELITIDDIP